MGRDGSTCMIRPPRGKFLGRDLSIVKRHGFACELLAAFVSFSEHQHNVIRTALLDRPPDCGSSIRFDVEL